jgi:hypothetical protein
MEPPGRASWIVALTSSILTMGLVAGIASAQTLEPPPAPGPTVITSLVGQFPPTVAGSSLEIITFSGAEWLAGFGASGTGTQFTDYLLALGVGPESLDSQVALASGVFINSLGASTALTAIAVCPADPVSLVENTLLLYGQPGEPPSTMTAANGDTLTTGTAFTDVLQIRAMAKSNVVWLIDASEPAVPEIMAAIPALPVACPV